MISKEITSISAEDLLTLIKGGVLERKTLEYKLILPSGKDDEKREFLADVSSFANASGGDIIFGIKSDSKSGTPIALDGITIENVDKEIARLDDIVRSGVQPRLPNFYIHPVKLGAEKYAIVIRISKSLLGPHRVIFKGLDRFYSRSSNGKYPLDVTELRTAFTLSENVAERVRKFREDRISRIVADELPIHLTPGARTVFHLIPSGSFNPGHQFDLSFLGSDATKLRPINSNGWDYRFNLDSFLSYSGSYPGRDMPYSYVQIYKNGVIEAVDSAIIDATGDISGRPLVPSRYLEEELVRSLKSYMILYQEMGIETPIFVFLTLVGAKGCFMSDVPGRWFGSATPLEQDPLMLPESEIESYDKNPAAILKLQFDSVWNACGLKGSPYYDPNGKWKLR